MPSTNVRLRGTGSPSLHASFAIVASARWYSPGPPGLVSTRFPSLEKNKNSRAEGVASAREWERCPGLHARGRIAGDGSAGRGGQDCRGLCGGLHRDGLLRRGRLRVGDAAGGRHDHRAAHHCPAAPVVAAAGIDTAIAGRAGRLAAGIARRRAGRRAAGVAHRCTARGAATRPPAMPSTRGFGIPARRDHGHAGERSNETLQQGLLADHRGNLSRAPGVKQAAPDAGRPSRGPETVGGGNGPGQAGRRGRCGDMCRQSNGILRSS